MPGDFDFAAVFFVEGTTRHDFILLNPGFELAQVRTTMENLLAKSPNMAEYMAKYRSKDAKDVVKEVKVKWSAGEGRDAKLWPKETVITDDNCEAVLAMMRVSGGRDVFEVKLQK